MATTYLDLVNIVCRRVNEEILTSSNFAAAEGAHGQIKEAVNAALRDVYQSYIRWPFLKTKITFPTVAGTVSYPLPDNIRAVDFYTFKINRDDNASPPIVAQTLGYMTYYPYTTFERPFDEQSLTTQWTVPQNVIKGRDSDIIITPVPDTVYSITYDAWVTPDDLVAYSDEMAVYDQFKHVVVDGALYYTYLFRSDTDSTTFDQKHFEDKIGQMLRMLVPQDEVMYVETIDQPRSGFNAGDFVFR